MAEAAGLLGALAPYLHQARRAGALAIGYRAVKQSLSAGRCALVLLAADAGASLRRLPVGGTPLLELGDRYTLGAWAGRSELAILGVTDRGLAAGILARAAALQKPSGLERR
jgi:ribosomal protein L7Ae-like RNA K-turn-binding protein